MFKISESLVAGLIHFKQQHTAALKTTVEECRSVNSSTVEAQTKQLLKITEGYEPRSIYNADHTGLFFTLPPNNTLSFKGNPYNEVKNSKQSTDNTSVSLQCWWNRQISTISYWEEQRASFLQQCQEVAHRIYNKQKLMGYTGHFYWLFKSIRG